MIAPTPVDAVVNPNNTKQRYVLWGTGRIDAYGGAPPITSGPQFFDRLDQPVCVALHITNWSTGQGYALDMQGGFQALNGAPSITSSSGDTFVNSNGLPYVLTRKYADWSWNPDGSGQGYAMDYWGELFPFGGATPAPRTGARFSTPAVKQLEMQWNADGSKKALSVDHHGAVWADFSATAPNPAPPYFATQDVVRDLVVTNWSTSAGFMLTGDGATHAFGGAVSPGVAGPYRKGQDLARQLVVLSASNPLRFWQVHAGGQTFEYVSSGPPTVTAGGTAASPATSTTTTTRPTLAWGYSDPQGDSQAAYEVLLFTQAYVTANSGVGTDPLAYEASAVAVARGTAATTRGVVMDVDLTNQAYRFYVRAQDTAGQWSAWSNRGWTQAVAVPTTPGSMAANPTTNQNQWQVGLSVAISGTVASLVRFEYSDDGGATWQAVRGAEAVPRAATTTAVDYDVPLGRTRGYRAVAYNTSPRTASSPSAAVYTSTLASNPKGRLVHVLTTTASPSLGGEVLVVDAPNWSNEAVAEVHQGLGAKYPVVIDDGEPKAARSTIGLDVNGQAEYDKIQALLKAGGTLLYRDPFGQAWYCKVVGEVGWTQVKRAPYSTELTPLGLKYKVTIPLVQVAQPVAV